MPKVFIVEDERIVAEDLKTKLEQYGYDVVGISDSGRNALDLIKDTRPDILIMDIRIRGDLDGVETAIIVESQATSQIPIVFLTAFSQDEFPVLKALDRYVYITKPFSDEDLLSALKTCLHPEDHKKPPR
jgi:two-component system, response regulator PdtaR